MSADPRKAEDVDSWAKEPCVCGHARFEHEDGGTGRCRHTRMQRVAPEGLSEPVLVHGDPFEFPSNWPAYDTWPEVEVPCCTGFDYPSSDEPEGL